MHLVLSLSLIYHSPVHNHSILPLSVVRLHLLQHMKMIRHASTAKLWQNIRQKINQVYICLSITVAFYNVPHLTQCCHFTLSMPNACHLLHLMLHQSHSHFLNILLYSLCKIWNSIPFLIAVPAKMVSNEHAWKVSYSHVDINGFSWSDARWVVWSWTDSERYRED